jgi:hypothetical protein
MVLGLSYTKPYKTKKTAIGSLLSLYKVNITIILIR